MSDNFLVLSNGDIQIAVDPGAAIHLKCVTPHGDPVELNADEARDLSRVLLELVERIERASA